MDPDFLNAFTDGSTLNQLPQERDAVIGEKRKCIKPSSRNDPKLEKLQTFLMDWINATLKKEHIVVKNLEEDLFDGLILHHLLEKLGSLTLEVEKIALTERKQRHKLEAIMEILKKCLPLEESELKWSVDSIFQKDLLSTLHLLVAIVKHFQPDLAIPPNVHVEVTIIEYSPKGLRTENTVEYLTGHREIVEDSSKAEVFDELMKLAPEKLDSVKKLFLQFVNKQVGKLGITVTDIDSQFADGVILLLLIGQLEGYFLNLRDFFLTPSSATEMLHNSKLAVDLLRDGGLLDSPVNHEDIVNRDMKTTLQVLYCLFSKYKTKEA
uniref:Gamma-parvin n=1 Tax=Sphenodon punctatus TaxID=8508 RepID=A0A8D0H7X1_SPHPU